MNALKSIVTDLRERRLWPIALVLLGAIIAVPVLLSSSSNSATPVAGLATGAQVAPPAGVPVVSTSSSPSGGRINGRSRDPFTQLVHGGAAGTGSNSAATTHAGAGGAAGTSPTSTTGASSTKPGASGGGAPTGTGTTPSSIVPTTTKPKPAPSGLTSTQSYDVKLAITTASGGLDTVDPLERMSVLPRAGQPLLVELGVLKGAKRVLFALQPGAAVGGPGSCIPGPVDCEILSLAQDQTESVSLQTSSGPSQVALFAVTGIRAAAHSSVAAANQARRSASAAGRALLGQSSSSVLPLFRYDPSIGAVVDERNLVIGG